MATSRPPTSPARTSRKRAKPVELEEGVEYLSAEDVARILAVSRTTAHKIMRALGRLTLGRVVRVSRAALEAWIAAHTEPPARRRRSPDDRQMAMPFADRRPRRDADA